MWGFFFFRWWLVNKLTALSHISYARGSVFQLWFMRAMGAKTGKYVHIHSELDCYDVVSIDDHSSIGHGSLIETSRIVNGYLLIGKVEIGKRCYVGNRYIKGEAGGRESASGMWRW